MMRSSDLKVTSTSQGDAMSIMQQDHACHAKNIFLNCYEKEVDLHSVAPGAQPRVKVKTTLN